jgi:hypothetical protein
MKISGGFDSSTVLFIEQTFDLPLWKSISPAATAAGL